MANGIVKHIWKNKILDGQKNLEGNEFNQMSNLYKNEYSRAGIETLMEKKSMSQIIAATIKTGIIKSNVFAMFAGLAMAMYMNALNPLDHLWDIAAAFIGSFLVIGAAGTFNNVYDMDIDAIMERTKTRPTVVGDISKRAAIWLGIIMSVIGVAVLYSASGYAALFGFLGLFFYVVPYTMWTKRSTVYNTEVGSISGAFPPLIGWAALSSDMTNPAIWGLFFVMVIWQMPHFYAIAIRKHDDYAKAKVPMLPVVKGFKRTYKQTNFYLVLLILVSFSMGAFSTAIMILTVLLSVIWLYISLTNAKKQDDAKWAKAMFAYSLLYLTILFGGVIIYSIVGLVIA